MNRYHLLSFICFISAIVLLAFGVLLGDVESGFVLIFPFVSGSGIYAFIGIILLFVAILLFMLGFVTSIESPDIPFNREDEGFSRKKTSVKGGGVVLIGPIPIVFGSSWKIAFILMVLALIIILVSLYTFKII
jgi:uncharacterized protein (TIGR00304 family)